MKTILCYGDSNTYGYDPKTGLRYPHDVRWTGHLQNILSAHIEKGPASEGPNAAGTVTPSEAFVVIEEGCNGRTTIADDPVEGWKNGLDYLRPCLNSHKPVDIVIMMLGTNDLKEIFHQTAAEIADHAGILVDTIRSFTKEKQGFIPKIILVSPPLIGEGMPESVFARSFAPRAIGESKLFAQNYKRVADEKGCIFFDAASYIEPSEEDSLHLMPDAHRTLAEELAKVILSDAFLNKNAT
ncbi:MAG: SGNH/GDSL hydrolase family protein [Clostridiales bacterium]|nr:SGNH/GDSL hydrolase family protein [Clostridiales bacterium]